MKWIKNIIYIALIAVLLILGLLILTKINLQAKQRFEYNLTYTTFIIITFFGGIGALLGLDDFIITLKKKGVLKVNKPRLLVLGIPSFIVSMTYIWATLGLFKVIPTIYPYLVKYDYPIIISSIILGHTIVSSLYKE